MARMSDGKGGRQRSAQAGRTDTSKIKSGFKASFKSKKAKLSKARKRGAVRAFVRKNK